MSYIPDDIIQRLESLPIIDVAMKLGIKVDKKGVALCFIHQEKNPSLHFYARDNHFYCFGCGKGGKVIKLVEYRLKCTFKEAAEWLMEEYNIYPTSSSSYQHKRTTIEIPNLSVYNKEKESYKPDVMVLNWIIENAVLSNEGFTFLCNERKYNPNVVKELNIKSITFEDRFCKKLIKTFGKERCIKSGILRWNPSLGRCESIYETPCLLFPFYDENGILYTIQGRSLRQKPTIRFAFPLHSESFIFNLQCLLKTDNDTPIFIAEGVTDCLALLSDNKRAIAIPGANSFKDSYIKYLKDKSLYMYADNDSAGNGLFERIDTALKQEGNYLHRLELDSRFKDYSDFYINKWAISLYD